MCVSSTWAVLAKQADDPKDKREAPVSYGAPSLSSHGYQAPASYSQGDASAISVGAGYSIGGAKPSYSFGQGSSGGLQIPSEGLSPNGHATIQLAPITLQPSHGGSFSPGDLSQIMSQLSHSFNTGGLSLQPSNTVAEFHQSGDGAQALSQGQELAFPQFSYGAPKFDLSQLSQQVSSAPAYSTGTKGLSSYTSTGPVLFNPSQESHSNAAAAPSLTYGAASSGHSLGDAGSFSLGSAGHSLGGSGQSFGGSGHTLGGAGHSLGGAGHSLGGSGHSFGGSSHSLGGSGLSLGGSGHSLGGSGHLGSISLGGGGHSYGGSYKQLSGYASPSKTSFKPSAFLGASVQRESGHSLSGLSGSYNAPSFGAFRGGSHGGVALSSAGHGSSFGGSLGGSFGSGASKFIGPVYKTEGLESGSSLSSGHFASPPGTTYGIPSSAYSANNVHAASSTRPYYVSTKHHRASPSSFGQGSSSFRAPASSHSSLSSFSSGPKYSFGSSSSPYESSDAHGSASETSYNTIKYSEELKPRVN